VDFTIYHPRDAAVMLGQQIRPILSQQGNFLRIALSGTDPEQIAATMNSLSERYVQVAAEIKRAQLDELTGVLDEQRRYAEETLRDTEMELEQFRVATVTLPSDRGGPVAAGLDQTQGPVMTHFFGLQAQLDQFRNDREAIERILAAASAGRQSLDALNMVPSASASAPLAAALNERLERRAEFRALQQRYTADHPAMVRLSENLTDLEQRAIPRLANELRAQIMDREADLRGRIGSASNELRQIPPRAIEEARLQRRVAIAENLHGMLKQRYEEVRLSAAATIPDIRVLDPAVVPTRPSRDTGRTMIFFGLLGGLGISLGGVILRDRFDTRVRYPEEVTYGMGLSILGAVPNVKLVNGEQSEAGTQAAEAFREIRMNLLYAHGSAGPVMLTITSPGERRWKVIHHVQPGTFFRRSGIRDADHRRRRAPRLPAPDAGYVAVPGPYRLSRGPGIDRGGAPADPVRQRCPDSRGVAAEGRPGTARQRSHGEAAGVAPAEVWCDPRGQSASRCGSGRLRAGYVDAQSADGLRTGATDRTLATAKLGMVDRLPIRLLGAVLNGTPSQAGVYRYYSYLPGYQVAPEDDERALAAAGTQQRDEPAAV
jgi:polysaccharide biosynthesis transport protein